MSAMIMAAARANEEARKKEELEKMKNLVTVDRSIIPQLQNASKYRQHLMDNIVSEYLDSNKGKRKGLFKRRDMEIWELEVEARNTYDYKYERDYLHQYVNVLDSFSNKSVKSAQIDKYDLNRSSYDSERWVDILEKKESELNKLRNAEPTLTMEQNGSTVNYIKIDDLKWYKVLDEDTVQKVPREVCQKLNDMKYFFN